MKWYLSGYILAFFIAQGSSFYDPPVVLNFLLNILLSDTNGGINSLCIEVVVCSANDSVYAV